LSRVPNEAECLAILREAGCSSRVIVHCLTVTTLARRMAEMTQADVELVVAGAMLHDLGRSRSHRIDHAVQGMRLAREMGLPEEVVEIIKRHIGAGMGPDEAAELGLPEDDYFPRTLEQRIVSHADNLTSDDHYVGHDEVMSKYERKGLPYQVERVEAMHRELSGLCGVDIDDLAKEVSACGARAGRRDSDPGGRGTSGHS